MNNQGYKEGTVSEEVGGIKDEVVGEVKNAYGAVTGDTATERAGEAQAARGDQRTEQNRMLTGLFRDRESAEAAYNSAISRGYSKDDINVMMADDTRNKWFTDDDTVAETELGSKALEGAGAGSAIGGTLGAIIAGIAAIGTSVLLPGVGLIVAGPLAAALAGAGAGGLTGGLVGALIGSGIPEDRAVAYESGLKEGGMVMGVNPRNTEDADYFENDWRNNRGEHIYR